jgi:hypothetical protein
VPPLSAKLGLTALSFGFNWLLASIAGIAALSWRPAGLLAGQGLPFWAQVLVGILVLDRLLGTFTPAARASSVVYGLDDADAMARASFSGLLTLPLRGREERESADTTRVLNASHTD